MLYTIEITETLQKQITIQANGAQEALYIIEKLYDDGLIVLDATDFTSYEFDVVNSFDLVAK